MDDTRFDATVKALSSLVTRRLTLGALLGGVLGRLRLVTTEAKSSSGKCKPRCDECEKCDKGACQRKNSKKRCQKGKCKPRSDGRPCTRFAAGFCVNGRCINSQTDEANCGSLGTVCGPTQVCQDGSCFSSSTCPATVAGFCSGTPTSCGSPVCACDQSTEGNIVCVSFDTAQCPPPAGTATSCTTSATCPPGSACMSISGSVCTCAAGAKICLPQCPTPDA